MTGSTLPPDEPEPHAVVLLFPFVAAGVIGPLGFWSGAYVVVVVSSVLGLWVARRYFGGFVLLPLLLWLLGELLWALAFLLRGIRDGLQAA